MPHTTHKHSGVGDYASPVSNLIEQFSSGTLTLSSLLRTLANEHALLDTKEVAAATGLTEWWVRRLICRGEIRAINVGTGDKNVRWRVDPEDLRAFMASRESRPRDLVAGR